MAYSPASAGGGRMSLFATVLSYDPESIADDQSKDNHGDGIFY